MRRCCGPKAFTQKIKVGDEEIPVRGLEPVMFMVYNLNLTYDEEIIECLLKEINIIGNVVPADKEKDFGNALLKEYKAFVEKRIFIRKIKIK